MKKALGVFTVLHAIVLVDWIIVICCAFAFTGTSGDFANNLATNASTFFNNLGSVFTNLSVYFGSVSDYIYPIIAFILVCLTAVLTLIWIIVLAVKKRPVYLAFIILVILGFFPAICTLANFDQYVTSLFPGDEITVASTILAWLIVILMALGLIFYVVFYVLGLAYMSKRKPVSEIKEIPVESLADTIPEPTIEEPTVAFDEPLPEPAPTFVEGVEPEDEPAQELPTPEPIPEVKVDDKGNIDAASLARAIRESVRDIVRDELARAELNRPHGPVPGPNSSTITGATFGGPLIVQYFNGTATPVYGPCEEPKQEVKQEVKEETKVEETPVVKEVVKEIITERVVEPTPEPTVEEKVEETVEETPVVKETVTETVTETVSEPTPVVEETVIEDKVEEPVVEEPAPAETHVVKEIIKETITERVVEPNTVKETVTETVTEKVVEPTTTTEETVKETVTETVTEKVVEPTPEPEPVVEPTPEPVVEPTPQPVVEPAPTPVVVAPSEPKEPKVYERISFIDRMIDSDKEMQDNYNIIKNEILSYGVKSRVSNSGDTFRLHKKTYVKITIAGKSLKLYFALDPNDYKDSTMPVQDAGHKGIYAEIPLVFKVRSELSMRRCKDLIQTVMEKDNLEQGEVGNVDWIEDLKAISLEKTKDDEE